MWNGKAETLNPNPTTTKITPRVTTAGGAAPDATPPAMSESMVEPVTPYSSDMP